MTKIIDLPRSAWRVLPEPPRPAPGKIAVVVTVVTVIVTALLFAIV